MTDTETTGISPVGDRLIEVAAVRVTNGVIVDRFAELVDPHRAIPGHISRLTGITNAMVYGCAPAHEVLPRFTDFLGRTSTLVAHNLTFDLRFLNTELSAAHLPILGCPTLCTLRLARRLLPGLRSKSLRSLTDFYRITNRRAHRALGDAEATAGVLIRLIDVLITEHRLEHLEEVLRFQYRTYRSRLRSRHLDHIRESVLPGLPSAPGVYFMKDSSNRCIYVGKARDLRTRVSSYFSAIEGHIPRTRRMVDAVRSIDWQETDTELEAMLLESRFIKELRPRFNRAQLDYRTRPFFRLSDEHAFPSMSVTPVLKDDGGTYFGPFESRSQADRIMRVLDRFFLLRKCTDVEFASGRPCEHARAGRCGAPCAGFISREVYAEERDRVLEFLAGRDTTVVTAIESAMRRAAEAMRYEDAAQLRDLASTVARTLDRDGCIAPAVLDQNAVLVLDHEKSRQLHLHFVRFGRLVDSMTCDMVHASTLNTLLLPRIKQHFDDEAAAPSRYYMEEVDEVRVIRQWAFVHRRRIRSVHWMTGMMAEDFCQNLFETVNQLLQSRPSDLVNATPGDVGEED